MKEIISENCILIYNPELEALWAADTFLLGEKHKKALLDFFSEETIALLSKKYRFLVDSTKAVSNLWLNGMTEFIVDFDVTDFSLEAYKKYVNEISVEDYLQIRLSLDDSQKSRLSKALADDRLFDEFYAEYEEKCPDYLGFYSFAHDVKRFVRDFFSLVDEIMTDSFMEYCKSCERKIESFFKNTKEALTKETPLDYSQTLMGKTFHNQGPYERFIFAPSSFCFGHVVRLFCADPDIAGSTFKQQILFWSMFYGEQPSVFSSERTVSALKALSDPTRYKILCLLSEGAPVYGLDIVKALSLAPSTVSHHMDQLKNAGLVIEEPVRQAKYYSINRANVSSLIEALQKDLKIN